ncbi:leucine-rich repeat domain-containing protein [Chaetoceros tenuissimus]|uniref:Leucine-rich repeat domain-containing protein n=1 Tax=Chaetoceros tenuissimus TaxID=426638 RepID=A0AAD3H4I2_9STRA|nr:leucine-rich repeat domain-containing protein [Chaetoceros tenuissimus]
MRVQTEEWRRFIPGSRMYKGKKTLFYNGEILYVFAGEGYRIYSQEERNSWEVIVVLPGVEVIPELNFRGCENLERVIMSDTVQRIEDEAFSDCESLVFVKLSRNLEYIGGYAFYDCTSLISMFIPPSCTEIDKGAFDGCTMLSIFNVAQQTQIGERVFANTALIRASPSEQSRYYNHGAVNEWVKNINQGEEYKLHRACSSFNPLEEIIYEIVKRKGPSALQKKNEIGLTAFDYLEANPFANIEIDQRVLLKRYVLEMMGETV